MAFSGKTLALIIFTMTLGAVQFWGSVAQAQSSYFTSQGCNGCHVAPVATTCNGCHGHGTHANSTKNTINVAASTNKSSYAPGETVSVTITGGYRSGWVRAALYDQNGVQIAKSSGTASGMGSATTLPATLTAPAPSAPGTYTWKAAWYGNVYDSASAAFGAGWTPDPTNPNHGEERVNIAAFTVTAPADTTPPALTVSTLADGSATTNATLNVAGTVSDAGGVASVTINGAAVTVTGGSFSKALTLVSGANVITTVASDNAGNKTTDTRTITYNANILTLTVATPADNSKINKTFVDVTGSVSEATATVTVNGAAASMNGTNFSSTVNLNAGINTIDITATDQLGNTANAKRTVTSDTTAPTLAVTDPAQDITTSMGSVTIAGTVADAQTAVTITITADGLTYTPAVTGGSFSQVIPLTMNKTYAVTVTAADEAGNQTSVTRNIISSRMHSGDVNGDGQVDIADALMELRIAVGLTAMDPAYLTQGDVAPYINGAPQPNGTIDISDALTILKATTGLITL